MSLSNKGTETGGDAARQPPLWRQLEATARLVEGVRDGRSLKTQLQTVEVGLRPGVQALSSHVLRWLGLANGLVELLARHAPPARVQALLCTALALLARRSEYSYTDFTLVNQTIEALKRDRRSAHQAGFLNACLRRFLRERDSLVAQAERRPQALWNHPDWWIQRLRVDYPEQWVEMLRANQEPAPMVLRVNTQKTSVDTFLQRAAAVGLAAEAAGGVGVRLLRPVPVDHIPGFRDGHVSVQSAAAQRAAPLLLDGLDLISPRVLDACAAPGGKTGHLLELKPQARVTALDVDAERCVRTQDNLDRLGLQAHVLTADVTEISAWWDGQQFDAILLDAPCSASGIVARQPDIRWLRRESDIEQLAALQERLLNALWPLLAPGGRLLYSTCSVFKQEGQQRIQSFITRNTEAIEWPSPGHLLPRIGGQAPGHVDNRTCEDDGFFYALLHKRLG